jgi:hypothetical protein
MLDEPVEQRRTQSQPPVVIPRLNLPQTRTDKEEREDKLKGKPNFNPSLFPDSSSKDGQGKISEKVACQEQVGGSRGFSRTQVSRQDAILNEI